MKALLTTFAFVLLTVQSQTPRSEGENTKKTHEISGQENGKSEGTPKPVIENQAIYSEPSKQQEQSKQGQCPNPAHDGIDYVNASSTAVIAVFTILLFIGVIFQVRTSRAIERAWVLAEIQWQEGEGHVFQGHSIEGKTERRNTAAFVQLVCKNEGNSPAWIEEKRMKFAIFSTLPEKPPLEKADIIQHGREPLGVGRIDEPITRQTAMPLAEGQAEHGQLSIIYGAVKYRDVFGKRRITTFGYQVTMDFKLKRLEGYPKYNDNA